MVENFILYALIMPFLEKIEKSLNFEQFFSDVLFKLADLCKEIFLKNEYFVIETQKVLLILFQFIIKFINFF